MFYLMNNLVSARTSGSWHEFASSGKVTAEFDVSPVGASDYALKKARTSVRTGWIPDVNSHVKNRCEAVWAAANARLTAHMGTFMAVVFFHEFDQAQRALDSAQELSALLGVLEAAYEVERPMRTSRRVQVDLPQKSPLKVPKGIPREDWHSDILYRIDSWPEQWASPALDGRANHMKMNIMFNKSVKPRIPKLLRDHIGSPWDNREHQDYALGLVDKRVHIRYFGECEPQPNGRKYGVPSKSIATYEVLPCIRK